MPTDTFLEVTSEPKSLSLQAGGAASIEYAVTNRTANDDNVRVVVPRHAVLTLDVKGDRDQFVAKGVSCRFTLEVSAPPGSSGEHDVVLDFVANSQSDRATSASAVHVSITAPVVVTAIPSEKRRFPWLIVAGAAVVLLAILGFAFVPGHSKTGDPCAGNGDCDGDHVCLTSTGAAASKEAKGTCLRHDDVACSASDQCAHGYCRPSTPAMPAAAGAKGDASASAGKCGARVAAAGPCSEPDECVPPSSCERAPGAAADAQGRCRLPLGSACERDPECQTGLCAVATGQQSKTCLDLPKLYTECTADQRCAPGFSCTSGGAKPLCLVSLEGECLRDEFCQSAFCLKEKCAPAPLAGTACIENKCGIGLVCDKGSCLEPGGFSCTADAQCSSHRCAGGTCASLGALKDPCTTNEQCEGGLSCEGGRCMRSLTSSCVSGDECGSSLCAPNHTCQLARQSGEICDAVSKICGTCLSCEGGRCASPRLVAAADEAVGIGSLGRIRIRPCTSYNERLSTAVRTLQLAPR